LQLGAGAVLGWMDTEPPAAAAHARRPAWLRRHGPRDHHCMHDARAAPRRGDSSDVATKPRMARGMPCTSIYICRSIFLGSSAPLVPFIPCRQFPALASASPSLSFLSGSVRFGRRFGGGSRVAAAGIRIPGPEPMIAVKRRDATSSPILLLDGWLRVQLVCLSSSLASEKCDATNPTTYLFPVRDKTR
jgi:hypothetical protein